MCFISFILGAFSVKKFYELYCVELLTEIHNKLTNHMDSSIIMRAFTEAREELNTKLTGDVNKKP